MFSPKVARDFAVLLVLAVVGGTTRADAAPRRHGRLHLGAFWQTATDEDSWDHPAPPPAGAPGAAQPQEGPTTQASKASHRDKPWHIDLAMRGSYTRLASTKQQLDRRLYLPMSLDVLHVFDEPYTPIDRRTDLGLATWYVGIGRQESEYLIWTWYAGGGSGQDLNHQRFLNSTLEVDFRYAYYYTGVAAELYPWRVPHIDRHMSWTQRLAASRPFLLGGLETGYVSAEGEGDYKVSGMLVYHDEQKVRDWLASVLVGAGWSFPLSERWSILLMGDYAFHFYRSEEYNGWNWITALRFTF